MEKAIREVRSELDQIAMQLDNYYVQIKLHHERKDYDKAIEIFKIIGPLNQRAAQLKEKLKFYRKFEAMNRQGILVKKVKKVDETSLVLD